MNKIKQIGFFAIALTFFFGAFAVSNSTAQVLNDILNRMDKHKDALQSIEADVAMTEMDSTIGISDTKTGKTYYVPAKGKNAYVRIDWTKPVEETLLVKNGKYILYRKRINQKFEGKVSDSGKNTKTNSALDFMNMSKSELRNNYSIQKLDNEKIDGAEVWHLKLTPKGKKSYEYAEIWVDGDGMPIQANIVEKNKDYTKVRLSSIKKNVKIKAEIFNWKPPSNAKLVG